MDDRRGCPQQDSSSALPSTPPSHPFSNVSFNTGVDVLAAKEVRNLSFGCQADQPLPLAWNVWIAGEGYDGYGIKQGWPPGMAFNQIGSVHNVRSFWRISSKLRPGVTQAEPVLLVQASLDPAMDRLGSVHLEVAIKDPQALVRFWLELLSPLVEGQLPGGGALQACGVYASRGVVVLWLKDLDATVRDAVGMYLRMLAPRDAHVSFVQPGMVQSSGQDLPRASSWPERTQPPEGAPEGHSVSAPVIPTDEEPESPDGLVDIGRANTELGALRKGERRSIPIPVFRAATDRKGAGLRRELSSGELRTVSPAPEGLNPPEGQSFCWKWADDGESDLGSSIQLRNNGSIALRLTTEPPPPQGVSTTPPPQGPALVPPLSAAALNSMPPAQMPQTTPASPSDSPPALDITGDISPRHNSESPASTPGLQVDPQTGNVTITNSIPQHAHQQQNPFGNLASAGQGMPFGAHYLPAATPDAFAPGTGFDPQQLQQFFMMQQLMQPQAVQVPNHHAGIGGTGGLDVAGMGGFGMGMPMDAAGVPPTQVLASGAEIQLTLSPAPETPQKPAKQKNTRSPQGREEVRVCAEPNPEGWDVPLMLRYLEATAPRSAAAAEPPQDTKHSKSRSPRNRRKIRERKIREAAMLSQRHMELLSSRFGCPVDAWISPVSNTIMMRPEGVPEDEWFRFVQACRKDSVTPQHVCTLPEQQLERLGAESPETRTAVSTAPVIPGPEPHPLRELQEEMIRSPIQLQPESPPTSLEVPDADFD